MNGYNGKDRRKCNYETIEKAVKENGLKLDVINGTVGRHKRDIKNLFERIRTVEDNEILEEGIRKGKTVMKTSTRNMITILVAGSLLFVGIIREVRVQKRYALDALRTQVIKDKNTDKDYIAKRFEGIEKKILDIIKHSMKGGGGGE